MFPNNLEIAHPKGKFLPRCQLARFISLVPDVRTRIVCWPLCGAGLGYVRIVGERIGNEEQLPLSRSLAGAEQVLFQEPSRYLTGT
jgi:hypothetical protein